MIAILVTEGTKNDCNQKSKTDHIWLQSVSKGTKYDCNVEHRLCYIVLESRDYCWTNLAETNFRWLQSYLSPFTPKMQSYFVRMVTLIAMIYESYNMIPCIKIYAIISGLALLLMVHIVVRYEWCYH